MYKPSHDDQSAGSRFPGLQQLISAALANAAFAEALLNDPARAFEHLPAGVMLTPEEQTLVMRVRGATNIPNFAAQLYALTQDSDLGAIELPHHRP